MKLTVSGAEPLDGVALALTIGGWPLTVPRRNQGVAVGSVLKNAKR